MALTAALMFFLLAVPAAAQQGEQADFEQLGQDLLRNIDVWTGQVNGKLQGGKPVAPEEFDSIFGENFLAGSADPLRDLELAQKRIESRLAAEKRKEVGDSYGKWMKDKLAPADLSPRVVSDDEHITVNLKSPEAAADSMKVDIAGNRITTTYSLRETRQVPDADGGFTTSSFIRKRRRAMAVPKGADPSRYRVAPIRGGVSIIFDRKKGKSTEASK